MDVDDVRTGDRSGASFSKVISEDVFRVLSLRSEEQGDLDDLKPVLEELEVMRLSCALGAFSSVSPEDFKLQMLEAHELDAEFARFLRHDVFRVRRTEQHQESKSEIEDGDQDGCNDGSSSRDSTTMAQQVTVLSVFGRQSEVKAELARLGFWSPECEARLHPLDQGIYCVKKADETPATTKRAATTLAVFAWLKDSLFEPQHLRGTATYVLRFLTCLSSSVVCCLSDTDIAEMKNTISDKETGEVVWPTRIRSSRNMERAGHWLWAFYHVFEKFPVVGLLDSGRKSQAPLQVKIVCSSTLSTDTVVETCKAYFESIMGQLHKLNKPLEGMDLADNLVVVTNSGSGTKRLAAELELLTTRSIHAFLQDVVTFVPIQICRAEGNMLTVMSDGQDKSSQVESLEQSRQLQLADIVRSIRFGLLSPLLESWPGRCIVVSAMGKQSTGKSYFLNHLTDSSFAIAGERCTDGAWMTVRVLPGDVMLVVLDFEGLGSFERTEQENVFLSVLNAAMSMFTIFRMEMRFDKEIDEIFSRFQKGVQLIKNDPRLFRGLLCMSVKDVNPNDQKGVVNEVHAKFQKLLAANKEQNFLNDMYGGRIEINCSPPLGTKGYYKSLQHTRRHIEKRLQRDASVGFASGKEFLDCLRLVLAKISILDWTSLDKSNQKLQLSEVRAKLPGLVRTGCLVPIDHVSVAQVPAHLKEDLVLLEAAEIDLQKLCLEFPALADKWRELDRAVKLDRVPDRDLDLSLDCSTFRDDDATSMFAVGESIARLFQSFLQRVYGTLPAKLSNRDQASFDQFLGFIVRRRKARILAWVKTRFGDRLHEGWPALEAQHLGRFQTLYTRCARTCASCQLGCMQSAVHSATSEHTCGTNHKCGGRCGYCEDLSEGTGAPVCAKPAGHEGKCECAKGDHTCGQECWLAGAPNCEKKCVAKAGHEGQHECAVEVHRCGLECSARGCSGRCIQVVLTPHELHKCEEVRCLETCVMDGCIELCGELNHFHGQASAGFDGDKVAPAIHMCHKAHKCQAMCGEQGNCSVEVFHKESSKTFDGARDKYKYTFQEMNGSRKKCSVVLAPGQQTHTGAHSCVSKVTATGDGSDDVRVMDDVDEDDVMSDEEEKQSADETTTRALHYCEARCPCRSFFCRKAYGHAGMHATSHGNMRNTYFLADDIDIEERKYKAGESGSAEMCNLYCSKMGRGHVHYLECEQQNASSCVYVGDTTDQRRHCTRVLEPRPAHEMDELLHDQFWKTLGWEDPCVSQDERENFGKCPYKCDAPEHNEKMSFCVLPAWHKPELKPANQDGFSYISDHKFACSHQDKMHHVFVLDCSGSMFGEPWKQLMAAFNEFIENRIGAGCILDVVSVVTFGHEAQVVYEAQDIMAVRQAQVPYRGGGTSFAEGLVVAIEVLSRTAFETYKPVLIFSSNGQSFDHDMGYMIASHIRQAYAMFDLKAFVVGYGSVNLGVLKRVAEELGASYHNVLVGTEIKTTFQISTSLGARAGLALTKPLHEIPCVNCQRDMAAEETVKLQPCGHELHKSCQVELMATRKREDELAECPVCRKEIVVASRAGG